MSRAQELLTAMKTDERLQEQMRAAATDGDRRKVIEDAGYADVSSAEVKAANAADLGELSDEQLGVASGAGGLGSDPYLVTHCWDLGW